MRGTVSRIKYEFGIQEWDVICSATAHDVISTNER